MDTAVGGAQERDLRFGNVLPPAAPRDTSENRDHVGSHCGRVGLWSILEQFTAVMCLRNVRACERENGDLL